MRLKIACIQSNAGGDWCRNLEKAEESITLAARHKPRLIALPETFLWRGPSRHTTQVAKESYREAVETGCRLAGSLKISLLFGSLLEPASNGKCYNTAVVISPQGRVQTRYRKIHLFDMTLDRDLKSSESRHIVRGRRPVTFSCFRQKAGLSICYDLRFPELYREFSARGCSLAFVPANFTDETGKAHWKTLLRARAIENQMFIIAPAQVGRHPGNGIMSFGHSLVVDPWGEILAEGSRGREEILTATLDFGALRRLRRRFPVLKHRRLRS